MHSRWTLCLVVALVVVLCVRFCPTSVKPRAEWADEDAAPAPAPAPVEAAAGAGERDPNRPLRPKEVRFRSRRGGLCGCGHVRMWLAGWRGLTPSLLRGPHSADRQAKEAGGQGPPRG